MHLPAMSDVRPAGWSSKWGSRAIPLLIKGPVLSPLRGGSRRPRRGLRVRPGICARGRRATHLPRPPSTLREPCVPRIASRGLRALRARWRRPKPEASAGRRSPPCKPAKSPRWLHHVLERTLPTHDSPEGLRTWREEANCTASPAARANAAGTGAPPTCAPPPTGARSLGVRWECPGQRLLFRPAACCLARLLRPALRCPGEGALRLPRRLVFCRG